MKRGLAKGDRGAFAASMIELTVILAAAALLGSGLWASVASFRAGSDQSQAERTLTRVSAALEAVHVTGVGYASDTDALVAKLQGIDPGLAWQRLGGTGGWDYEEATPYTSVWVHLWEGCTPKQEEDTRSSQDNKEVCTHLPPREVVSVGLRDADGGTLCLSEIKSVANSDWVNHLGTGYQSVSLTNSLVKSPDPAGIHVAGSSSPPNSYPWQNIATCLAPGLRTRWEDTNQLHHHWLCERHLSTDDSTGFLTRHPTQPGGVPPPADIIKQNGC